MDRGCFMLEFKIKKLDNVKFDINELIDYFYTLEKDYQHLKWTVPENLDPLTHRISELYSWAIQSNLKDPTKPCPPYHIQNVEDRDQNDSFQVPTELIFGFGKKIIDSFPNVRQTVIACHPPGTFIDQHIDSEEFVKIHIPIKTNNDSFFIFGEEKFNLEVGNAYLVNTAMMHGTENNGDTDRIHLIFKITEEDAKHIIETEYVLDQKMFDFDLLELDNIKFNFNELLEYYDTVKNNFEYLKWIIPEIPDHEISKGLYGYAILTNKENIDEPVDPPGTRKDKKRYEPLIKHTKIVFGFAERLLEKIPYQEELVITGHPSGVGIPTHVDKDEHLRIHFPIISNKNSEFIINGNTYILEPGKVYIVNTKRSHTTLNNGDDDRVHLHFKIPIGRIKELINQKIVI